MNDNRPPHADNDVIDDLPTPSHSGSSGGEMAREIGARDEDKTMTGADPQPTSVHKGDRANKGDEPNLPNRNGEGEAANDRAPPRRTS